MYNDDDLRFTRRIRITQAFELIEVSIRSVHLSPIPVSGDLPLIRERAYAEIVTLHSLDSAVTRSHRCIRLFQYEERVKLGTIDIR